MMKPYTPSRAATTVAATLGVCLLAVACPPAALAASGGENTPLPTSTTPASPATSSGGASLVRTIVGLAIVIAVIWGLSWVLKQVKAGREPNASSVGLASVAALTLGSGRTVHLVRAGTDFVLIGSGEHGLVPIHRYTEEQARESGLLMLDEPGQAPALSTGTGLPRSGQRRDPMGSMPAGTGIVERLRELTVRR